MKLNKNLNLLSDLETGRKKKIIKLNTYLQESLK
jgi:hypothetical protein